MNYANNIPKFPRYCTDVQERVHKIESQSTWTDTDVDTLINLRAQFNYTNRGIELPLSLLKSLARDIRTPICKAEELKSLFDRVVKYRQIYDVELPISINEQTTLNDVDKLALCDLLSIVANQHLLSPEQLEFAKCMSDFFRQKPQLTVDDDAIEWDCQ